MGSQLCFQIHSVCKNNFDFATYQLRSVNSDSSNIRYLSLCTASIFLHKLEEMGLCRPHSGITYQQQNRIYCMSELDWQLAHSFDTMKQRMNQARGLQFIVNEIYKCVLIYSACIRAFLFFLNHGLGTLSHLMASKYSIQGVLCLSWFFLLQVCNSM